MSRLDPFEEVQFQKWYANIPEVKSGKISANPDDPEHFYDYRGAYLANAQRSEDAHFPSEFKKMGHPRAFLGGRDTRTGEPTSLSTLIEDILYGER